MSHSFLLIKNKANLFVFPKVQQRLYELLLKNLIISREFPPQDGLGGEWEAETSVRGSE